MKRSTIAALCLGALVSTVIIALHVTRVTLPLEEAAMSALSFGRPATKVVGAWTQCALVVILSVGIAWILLASTRRKRLGWPLAILALELVTISWVCLLYEVFFQPLPSLLAVGLSFATANGFAAFSGRSRPGPKRDRFVGRLSEDQISKIVSGELLVASQAKSYEATAVVCDISNKHDLADECPPVLVAEITEKFIHHATESFLKAGAYLESVTGEGIVAIFGFPAEDALQAERATRHALALLDSFAERRRAGRDDIFEKFDVHFGISSGTMILAPLSPSGGGALLATGEPVELARRFCIANRFYGSHVLIGPRTFELTSKVIVARPIDFLSGVDVRERHEIYEPLGLAAGATPEEIARRDSFWNGVVLYREKRWAEAYSQFQKARGSNDELDAPLQLYVRRLEPLALHLTESPDD